MDQAFYFFDLLLFYQLNFAIKKESNQNDAQS